MKVTDYIVLMWLGLLLSGCGGGGSPASPATSTQGPGGLQSGNPSNPGNPGSGGTGGDGGTIANPNPGTGGDGGYVDTRTAAQLVATPSQYNFQIQSFDSKTNLLITLANTGQKPATAIQTAGLLAPYEFRDGGYPGFRGNCGTVLAGGASCQISITFHPTAMGRFISNSFTVLYDNGSATSSLVIPLDGTATNIATLRFSNEVDDNSYSNFGQLAYGVGITQNITVHYFGARPATGVTFSGLSGQFTILSNSCAEEVSADCVLSIRYTGSSVGVFSQKLKVTYHNGSYAAEDNYTFNVEILAPSSPAVLAISDGASNTFGQLLIPASADRVFTVTRSGTLPATSVSGASFAGSNFAFKDGSYPGTGGSCGATVTGSCTLVIHFASAVVGDFSDTIRLNYFDGASNTSASRAITGQGRNPAVLGLTPVTSSDFGSAPVGATVTRSFRLSNLANSITATGVSLSALTAPFAYTSNCGSTLVGGGTCTFVVRFVPASVGDFGDIIQATYFNGLITRNDTALSINGHGSAGASLSPSVATYDFGNVWLGNSASGTIIVSYYGTLPAVSLVDSGLNAVFTYVGGSYPGTGGTCSASITGNCTLKLQFAPAVVGLATTTYQLSYQDGTGATQSFTINLRGTGINPQGAVLAFSPTSYDFGDTTILTTKSTTITVNRTGNYGATVMSASGLSGDFVFKGGSYPGTGGSCSASLSGSSCTLVVNFTPSVAGQRGPASLTLSYFNGVTNSSAQMNFMGNGIDIAVITASPLVFGSFAFGSSANAAMTIRNTGTHSAASLVFAALVAPFQVLSDDCGGSLAAGAQCAVNVRFSPSRPGRYSANLSGTYDSGLANTPFTGAVSGNGTISPLIAANGNHSCGRNIYGETKCWGQNNYGQLGLGDSVNRGATSGTMGNNLPTVSIGTNRYAKAIALGYWHSCAILDDDSLKCWGSNSYGQLGLGSAQSTIGAHAGEMGDSLAAVNLGFVPTAIAAGYSHTCALSSLGKVKCWGQNSEGQLGLGDSTDRGQSSGSFPDVDLGGYRATQITANVSHTCALLENSTVRCWGNNFFGQLGLGDVDNRGDDPNEMGNNLENVDLGSGAIPTSVVAGGAFTCALLQSGQVKCWGRNEHGILGRTFCQDADGNTGVCGDVNYPLATRGYGLAPNQMGNSLPFIALGSGRTAVSLVAMNSAVCATLDDGSLKCWGANEYGQLGLGDAVDRGLSASEMGNALSSINLGGGVITSLVAGDTHACALLGSQVKCWGYNRYGQLGLEDAVNRGDAAGQMGSSLPFVAY